MFPSMFFCHPTVGNFDVSPNLPRVCFLFLSALGFISTFHNYVHMQSNYVNPIDSDYFSFPYEEKRKKTKYYARVYILNTAVTTGSSMRHLISSHTVNVEISAQYMFFSAGP